MKLMGNDEFVLPRFGIFKSANHLFSMITNFECLNIYDTISGKKKKKEATYNTYCTSFFIRQQKSQRKPCSGCIENKKELQGDWATA